MNLFRIFLDFIFPPACPLCNDAVANNNELCAACWAEINWISAPICATCGYPFPANIDKATKLYCPQCASGKPVLEFMRGACVYDDASRKIMLPFKHAHALRFRDIMSRAMIASLANAPEFDLIMPVPLATRRLFHRGYNQATLLARPIAKHLNLPIDLHSVTRKHRPDMGHKSAAARHENIRGVFTVRDATAIRGKRILLVDDVFTTGATFSELRKVLMRAGAKSVGGVTFCRVVRAI